MKQCPKCGMVNPDTGEVCDCGHSFKTGGLTCPKCQYPHALQDRGTADAGGRMAAGLVGGSLAKQVLYGSAANEIHCKQCGHTFRASPKSLPRKPKGLFLVILLFVLVLFAVFYLLMMH